MPAVPDIHVVSLIQAGNRSTVWQVERAGELCVLKAYDRGVIEGNTRALTEIFREREALEACRGSPFVVEFLFVASDSVRDLTQPRSGAHMR